MNEGKDSIVLFQEILQNILESADNNLNAYVNGSRLELSKSRVEPEEMEKLFSLLPDIDEEYILKIAKEKKEYSNSSKFFKWLYDYAKNIKEVFQKVKPLCEMERNEFEDLVGYCIDNVILHNNGIRAAAITDQPLYSAKNLSILCSIIDRYFERIFYNGDSRTKINSNIRHTTNLSKEKCDILWEHYLKNEEALWRKYSMQLQVTMNKTLNDLLDVMLNMDEDEIGT